MRRRVDGGLFDLHPLLLAAGALVGGLALGAEVAAVEVDQRGGTA